MKYFAESHDLQTSNLHRFVFTASLLGKGNHVQWLSPFSNLVGCTADSAFIPIKVVYLIK